MAELANYLGLGATALLSMPLLGSILNLPPIGSFTHVKIGLGTSASQIGTEDPSLGGDVPAIALWDATGNRIGFFEGGGSDKILSGTDRVIAVQNYPEVGDAQSQYIAVSATGDDAVCIAYIAVTWPDGGQRIWSGDIGFTCGADWYNSQTIIGTDNATPKCVWIDRNRSNGLRFQALGMHYTDFTSSKARAAQYNAIKDSLCKSKPRFNMYTDFDVRNYDQVPIFSPPLEYSDSYEDADVSLVINNPGVVPPDPKATETPDYDPVGVVKREKDWRLANATKSVFMEGHLVISHLNHSALELCRSDTSRGPDFVSVQEGFFCDMETKTALPLCGSVTDNCCFDHGNQTIRVHCKHRRVPLIEGANRVKKYDSLHHWGTPA